MARASSIVSPGGGMPSGGTGNSCSPATRSGARLVTTIVRSGAARSSPGSCGAAARTCSTLSMTTARERGARNRLSRSSTVSDAAARHEAERCGEDARDELGVVDRLERDEPRAVPESVRFASQEFDRKARLSRAAGSDEGEQPVRIEQAGELVEFGVPTDEAGQAGREVATARATSRLERRELGAGGPRRAPGRSVPADRRRAARARRGRRSATPSGSWPSTRDRVASDTSTCPPCAAAAIRAARWMSTPDVVVAAQRAEPRVDAHPDADFRAVGPRRRVQGALRVDGRRDRRGCLGEQLEEGIALRPTLDPGVPRERVAEDGVVPLEELGIGGRPEVLDEPGRPLDVREQEGDRAGREWALTHGPSRIRPSCRAATYWLNHSVVSMWPASESSSARWSRASPADTRTLRLLPAASVAPDQCSSASSALRAGMYASIEAAMMFGRAPRRGTRRCRARPRVRAARCGR